MAPITDRTGLEALKHKDLQKMCKEWGLRANLKSEAMIDLLLDAQKTTGNNRRPSGRRSVSTRMSSRLTTAGRTSSMIVHDIDEDEEEPVEPDGEEEQEQEEQEGQPELQEVPQPPPRTRKAKETQLRLGMGRPVAAGGRGARAVTKSISVSKSKKGKGSRSVKPLEATILEEEPEPENTEPAKEPAEGTPTPPAALPSNVTSASPSSSSEFDARVMRAMKPLHQQLEALKSELGQMQVLKNELSQIRNQVGDIEEWKQKVETLTSEVKELREKAAVVDSLNTELQQLKGSISQRASSPTSDEAASGFHTPIMTRAPISNTLSIPRAPALVSESRAGPSYLSNPGMAPILLGKRHRDSTSSNVTGVVEEAEESALSEADMAKTVLRPDKKRQKLGDGPDDSAPAGRGEASSGASFTVFRGPEPDDSYIDPPPPTIPLPAFYTASTPPNNGAGPSRQRVTSTQDAAENIPQSHFTFSFMVPPTPGGGDEYSMPFPYPEPPQSPTPARDNNPGLLGNTRDRTDMFSAFGLPPPGRPRSRLEPRLRSQEAELGAFINPAALENRDGGESSGRSDDADAMKRTMYGTELEGDTRFGDFGLETIGSDFNWTGAY